MCEIAIIDPAENSTDRIVNNTEDMFSKNPDGIGLIAIRTDGEEFDYNLYKAPFLNRTAVRCFVEKHSGAWRLIIHARLSTHGDEGIAQTHPIEVDCDLCDPSMVLHNGVVRNQASWRRVLEEEGHSFTTEVDSEVILHEFGSPNLPLNIEDLRIPDMRGSLNFAIFQSDRILVRSGGTYDDVDTFLMGKPSRCSWDGSSKKMKYMLISPDKEVQVDSLSTYSSKGYTKSSWASWGGWDRGADDNEKSSGSRYDSHGIRKDSSELGGEKKEWHYWEDWPPDHLRVE